MVMIWCMHVIQAPKLSPRIRTGGTSKYVADQYVLTISFTKPASATSDRRSVMPIRLCNMASSLGKVWSITGASVFLSSLSLYSYLRQSSMMTCTAPVTRGTSSVCRYEHSVGSSAGHFSG